MSLITKVGTTSTGCLVYHFKGLGYWVAPSHLYIQLTAGRMRICLRVYGKVRSRGFMFDNESAIFPKAKFEETVTKLHELTPYGFYLGKFRENWLLHPETMVYEWLHDSRYSRIVISPPTILNDRQGEAHHISFFLKNKDDHRKAVLAKAHEAAVFTRDYFKEKYKRPIYDTFRYHVNNPTLNDTTRTDNIKEFNRRLSKWCLSAKHALPGTPDCKGSGNESKPGDTRALIQALTGVRRTEP